MKLANGVFVSPSYLENIYKECHLIEQIFVHASGNMVAVGCVCVLDDRMVQKYVTSFQDCVKNITIVIRRFIDCAF